MRKISLLGLFALLSTFSLEQPASAWLNVKFGAGVNWNWQAGGNNLLCGLYRNGQPPGFGCGDPSCLSSAGLFGGGANDCGPRPQCMMPQQCPPGPWMPQPFMPPGGPPCPQGWQSNYGNPAYSSSCYRYGSPNGYYPNNNYYPYNSSNYYYPQGASSYYYNVGYPVNSPYYYNNNYGYYGRY